MKFLKINSSMLKMDTFYTFPIFLYDHSREQRLVALHKSSVVTQELLDQWSIIEEKGGHLQIEADVKRDFLFEAQTTADQVDSLNQFELRMIELEKSRSLIYKDFLEEEFLFISEITKAVESNDFHKIINRAKAELLMYPLTISDEVSMMTQLVDKLFVQDTFVTRMSSFTYFFTKSFGIKDQKMIAQIVIASLLKDVGLTLINLQKLKDSEDLLKLDLYLKHPMLSIFLLSKHPIELSKDVKRIILEQHETIDGEGFPNGKKENYIAISSQIVHLCDHLFKYATGKIDGKNRNLQSVMKMIANKNQAKGLVTNFSDSLLDNLKLFSNKEVEY